LYRFSYPVLRLVSLRRLFSSDAWEYLVFTFVEMQKGPIELALNIF